MASKIDQAGGNFFFPLLLNVFVNYCTIELTQEISPTEMTVGGFRRVCNPFCVIQESKKSLANRNERQKSADTVRKLLKYAFR